MNFLAHAFLAEINPALMVGGVTGDWIKGILPGMLPKDLAQGVALHRALDGFVDSHPAFHCSRQRISAQRRRYAGVLVDIFYDHLLARDWPTYHTQTLEAYCSGIYQHIEDRLADLPEAAHPALLRMRTENWLLSYRGLDGIGSVLQRMSRRARFPNPLAFGEEELRMSAEGFLMDFRALLPDAQHFVTEWIAAH